MKKTIGIFAGGLPFTGDSIKTGGLGGSESAVVYMARELSTLGNEVTVYCNCPAPGIYDNVNYDHYSVLAKNKPEMDILITSRDTAVYTADIPAKMDVLWNHDASCKNISEAAGIVETMFVLSDYHKKIFKEQYPQLVDDILTVTTNGFDDSLVGPKVLYSDKKNNYIYASRPERGLLKLLIEIWPSVLRNNPNAKLHLCSYLNNIPPAKEVEKLYKDIEKQIKKSKGIVQHGSLPKKEFYDLLSNCAYMLYPCTFPEISCISAIEAQANRCLVIGTDDYALSETIKSDTKFKIEPKLGETVVKIINEYSSQKYEDEVNKAYNQIQSYRWSSIANTWNTLFNERLPKYLDAKPKTVSCCMIVKNEEDCLSKCLKSVKDIVDEIIIVDTGSTDDTKRIAAKFTDKIYDLVWEEEDGLGNFARARNESIKYATGDYILFIDADEELIHPEKLKKFIKNGYYDSVVVAQKHIVDATRVKQFDDNYPDRLFKNDGTIHFEGVVHEQPYKKDGSDKKYVYQAQSYIFHYGNIIEHKTHAKAAARNSALIHKNARMYPDRLITKSYLIVDEWVEFINSKCTDIKRFQNAMDIWVEHFLKDRTQTVAKSHAYRFIQLFYETLAPLNKGIMSRTVVIRGETKQIFGQSDVEIDYYRKVIFNET